jgi:uncharacterized membrane protein
VLALILSWSRVGILLWPIVGGVYAEIALALAVARWRRGRLAYDPADDYDEGWKVGPWWRSLPRARQRRYRILAAGMLLGVLFVTVLLAEPLSMLSLSEFYLTEQQGLAQNYPQVVSVGAASTATLGIVNRQWRAQSFRVEVYQVQPWGTGRRALLTQVNGLTLAAGQRFEQAVTWRMLWPGDDQRVDFLLYTASGRTPYRELHLWLNVSEQPSRP